MVKREELAARRAEVARLFDDGLPQRTIGRRLGLSRDQVVRDLRATGRTPVRTTAGGAHNQAPVRTSPAAGAHRSPAPERTTGAGGAAAGAHQDDVAVSPHAHPAVLALAAAARDARRTDLSAARPEAQRAYVLAALSDVLTVTIGLPVTGTEARMQAQQMRAQAQRLLRRAAALEDAAGGSEGPPL